MTLALWKLCCAYLLLVAGAHAEWNVTDAVFFADHTWNCGGDSPPCYHCANRVPAGSSQDPYGCAPFVAHCLAAGGEVPLDKCGDQGGYDAVKHQGIEYNLNVVSHQDPNCGKGNLCLLDYLKAKGWQTTKIVKAGTVCAVVGEDNGQPVP
jgi:hypothetical protein